MNRPGVRRDQYGMYASQKRIRMRATTLRLPALALSVIGLFACLPGPAAAADRMEAVFRTCIYPDLTRIDAVIRACTTVIKSGEGGDAAQISTHLSRGNMYRRKGQYDRALADYDQALKLDPLDPAPTLTSRGNAWRGKHQYDRAIADHTEAIRLDPDYAIAYSNRGNVWSDKGDWDKAMADYDKAIALDPKYAEAFYNRGIAWEAKQDRAHALEDYRTAVKLRPDFTRAIESVKELEAEK
jgi:tetratricopeptide (TPR) repeat protein